MERRKEREEQEAKVKRRKSEQAKNQPDNASDQESAAVDTAPHADDGLLPSERKIAADVKVDKKDKEQDKIQEQKKANDNARKDVLLNEAAHIIDDEISLIGAKPQ